MCYLTVRNEYKNVLEGIKMWDATSNNAYGFLTSFNK